MQFRLYRLILITFFANLAASLMMAFILAQATIAGGLPLERMKYITENKLSVQLGWASWIAATLSLVLFFQIMYEYISKSSSDVSKTLLRYAWILSAVGAAPDIIADMISFGIIPYVSERALSSSDPVQQAILLEQFLTFDRMSVFLTGGLGNTCYGLAGIILSYVIIRENEFTPLIRWMGVPLWGFTFLMSYESLVMSETILPVAVGGTMFLFLLWIVLIYFNLFNKQKQEF